MNELYGESNSYCGRCKTNNSELICSNCDSQFKFVCLNCDNVIHSLPSKKNHKRISISSAYNEEKANKAQGVKVNLSKDRERERYKDRDRDKDRDHYDNYSKKTIDENNYEENIDNVNVSDNLNPNHNSNLNLNANVNAVTNTIESKISAMYYISDSYSREYLNEVKSVYEKEKSELAYKYLVLQNNSERMKNSLTEQISSLQNQIDDLNRKFTLEIKYFEEEHSLIVQKIQNEKELEIKKLIENIELLEQANDKLYSEVESNYNSMQDYKQSFKHKLQDLNEIIEKRDIEIKNIKMHYEKILNDLTKTFESEQKRTVMEYEDSIHKLRQGLDSNEKSTIVRVIEKDKEYKDEIEKSVKELEYSENTIIELRKEVEFHKQNLLAYRTKRQDMEKELDVLYRSVEKFKKESNNHLTQLKMIDSENKTLMKDNDELKLQITKLERFIQGKKVGRLC